MRQSRKQAAAPWLRTDFDDVEYLCASVRSWDLDFRPLVAAAPRCTVAQIEQQQEGDLELAYARLRVSMEQLGEPPAGRLTFAVLGEGVRRIWWRGQDVDARTVLAFPIGAELRCLSSPDFEVYTVSVPLNRVELLCNRFHLPLPPPRRRLEIFRPSVDALAVFRDALRRARYGSLNGDSLDGRWIGETLVLAWLREHSTGTSGQPAPLRARDRAVRACLERMDQADWSELSPSVLCEVGRVGERTLQYAFRERFGLTPAAFLKARRLAALRRFLMNRSPQDNVGDIAHRFGFWHTGQLAADYRRTFGESPSATLNRRCGGR